MLAWATPAPMLEAASEKLAGRLQRVELENGEAGAEVLQDKADPVHDSTED